MFPDIEHLNTAKVYCTITEATRKPAYFKHGYQPIIDHFKKDFGACVGLYIVYTCVFE